MDLSNPDIRYNVFMGSLLTAFTFYSIQSYTTNTLLSIIIIFIISWIGYSYIKGKNSEDTTKKQQVLESFNKEIDRLDGAPIGSYLDRVEVGAFPKGTNKTSKDRYIGENGALVDIAQSLSKGGLRKRDRTRYAELLLLMNRYQRMYMHILMDLEDAELGISTFNDLGDLILENMYSIIFIYPFKESLIQENIIKFTDLRRTMALVLESYAKKELGVHVVPISVPRAVAASQKHNSFLHKNQLP